MRVPPFFVTLDSSFMAFFWLVTCCRTRTDRTVSKVSVLKGRCSTSARHSGAFSASFLAFARSPLEKSAPMMFMPLERGLRKRPLPQPASNISVLSLWVRSRTDRTDWTSAWSMYLRGMVLKRFWISLRDHVLNSSKRA